MTEKRFIRRDYAIYEKGNPICMTLRDVDKRLNELWEEKEQLKEQNRQLRLENGKLSHDLFWANKKIEEELQK